VVYERPESLLGRLKLGREEYLQRLLTSLIVGGPYPRWNSRSAPSAEGLQFLRRLWDLSFNEDWPGDADLWFVDELELLPRHDRERGGAPDQAVLWDHLVWLIEMKTEAASHRRDQIPSYFKLGRHHHPSCRVAITYLTGPGTYPLETTEDWARYAHVTWAEVAPLIRETWPASDDDRGSVVDGLLDGISSLDLSPSQWRAQLDLGGPARLPLEVVAPPEAGSRDTIESAGARQTAEAVGEQTDARPLLERAMSLASDTAETGRQNILDWAAPSLEDLLELRLAVRDAIAAAAPGSPVRHVRPWLWRPESTGAPLTEAGRATGYELRFSRYQKPQY
jgi:hypothetical protein